MRNLLRSISGLSLLASLLVFQAGAQSTNNTSTNLTGQWDFNQSNLKATIGTDMQFAGNSESTTTFEQAVIDGNAAKVLHFADASDGYVLFHGAKPNGGGTNVNLYTLVLDLMWPAESDGTFRALFSTDTNHMEDAVMFVNPDGGVGINNNYSGAMQAGNWYRLALVFNLTNGTVTKYFNGETNSNSVQFLGENVVDSEYSLGPALLLFGDNDGEVYGGLLDRVQFYDTALTDEQVAALGAPIGDQGPPVTGDVKIDSIKKVGTNFEIAVSGGGTLQLQRADTLSSMNWTAAGQVTNSGTLTVPSTGVTGFFRVKRL